MENWGLKKAFATNIVSTFFYLHFIICRNFILVVDTKPTTDIIVLNCGFSGTSSQYGDKTRAWVGDINSKFFPFHFNQNNASITFMLHKSLTTFPRISTRLSRSVITYSFPVSPGQKLVRLHFNSASYPNFDRSKAVFSVKTGRFTLLKDFDADAFGVDGIVREFCVHVEEHSHELDLTFTPTNQESYAFISGIEIVSMPEYLFYAPSKPNNKLGSLGLKHIISHVTESSPNKNYMYEVLYRINIGGRAISPEEDTGMFRFWSNEESVLLPDVVHDARPANLSIKLNYSQIRPYTAPDDIYRTARSMGRNATENKSYNLTWDYLVDPGFFYILRLHFCEFQSEIHEQDDRVFLIYIADKMVEEAADVVKWAGGNGIPYRKDYIVSMPHTNQQEEVNLSVKLQANPDDSKSRFANVILNGIEIFQVKNDDHDNLTNQFLQSPILRSKNSNIKMVAIIIPVVVGGIAAMLVLGLFVFRRCRTLSKDQSSNDTTTMQLSMKNANKTRNSNLPSELCRYFSLQQIKDATNNFDDIFIIGVGGFGNVYRGYIDDGATQVAIKRLKIGSKQGAHEFRTEIEILSQLRHRHLVSLIGYCNERNEMILIYDYMCQGTLRSHLYGDKDEQPLSWKQRLKLCIGAAKGLHYLHTGTDHIIIHRDVKTTNILVDDKWVARVSDFGLSKVGATSTYKGHVSTVVKGSFGYLDPEYCRRQQLSEKSDVYSFGVVLCEVLCASPPLISTANKTHILLAKWVQEHIQEKKVTQIIDSNIKNEITLECFKKFMQIVVSCIQDEGVKRPSMDDVVRGLEVASQLQESLNEENVELRISLEDGDHAWLFEEGMASNNIELATSSSKSSSFKHNIGMSGIVFSELKDMEGR